MINFAESVEEQAGWFSTIIMGGPVPGDEGRISTLMYVGVNVMSVYLLTVCDSYHHGTTKDKRDFKAFVGPAELDKNLEVRFDEFLNVAFGMYQ